MDDPSNPRAFPRCLHGTGGMTLRDWFAGQFGTACASALLEGGCEIDPKRVAQAAYAFSDAMLAEREQGK